MSNPYKIDGQAVINFSGGRSSAYMLFKILQAYGGALPNDKLVVFANTGKEMPETLDFVQSCEERWGVPITWLEFRPGGFEEVNYSSASRAGEPYSMLIEKKNYLPNPVTRFCTVELKIRVTKQYVVSQGWEHWTSVLGLRADEPRRVAKSLDNRDRWDNYAPMYHDKVTKKTVAGFWRRQNFDLMLPSINGTTPYGNCDLCFLKSAKTIQRMIKEFPEIENWWVEQEQKDVGEGHGRFFRKDRPSYLQMREAVAAQDEFDFGDIDSLQSCFCGD